MKIAVIGSGYVGLVVGTCFADTGNRVTCVDIDGDKISKLKRGDIPIFEPGLVELIQRNSCEKRLKFSTDISGAVREASVVFIAVGTPPDEDGGADLSHVLAVAELIGDNMNNHKTVVLKSTVPVGTNRKVRERIGGRTKQSFDVVSNPEFLKEGAAIDDFNKPDRVVVGVETDAAREIMEELYSPYLRTGKPILFMDPSSAEMTKYAANAMLAIRISFMNEIARICEVVGADVNQVRKGIGTDTRIGFPFLFAGVGYGGSCFPKDVRALVQTARENGYEPHLVPAAETVNAQQKRLLFSKIDRHFDGDLKGRRFAIWGLAFKPKTDDMREAPSLVLIEDLLAAGAEVTAYDPEAIEEARRILGDRIHYSQSAVGACEGADALVLVTEWSEFRHVDLGELKPLLRQPLLFDGRNIWDASRARAMGYIYHGVGVL